jgi:hypothetical protein
MEEDAVIAILTKWKNIPNEHARLRSRYCQEWLYVKGIPYHRYNGGKHLRITCFKEPIDIWPYTGRIKIGTASSKAYNGAEYIAAQIMKLVRR